MTKLSEEKIKEIIIEVYNNSLNEKKNETNNLILELMCLNNRDFKNKIYQKYNSQELSQKTGFLICTTISKDEFDGVIDESEKINQNKEELNKKNKEAENREKLMKEAEEKYFKEESYQNIFDSLIKIIKEAIERSRLNPNDKDYEEYYQADLDFGTGDIECEALEKIKKHHKDISEGKYYIEEVREMKHFLDTSSENILNGYDPNAIKNIIIYSTAINWLKSLKDLYSAFKELKANYLYLQPQSQELEYFQNVDPSSYVEFLKLVSLPLISSREVYRITDLIESFSTGEVLADYAPRITKMTEELSTILNEIFSSYQKDWQSETRRGFFFGYKNYLRAGLIDIKILIEKNTDRVSSLFEGNFVSIEDVLGTLDVLNILRNYTGITHPENEKSQIPHRTKLLHYNLDRFERCINQYKHKKLGK